MTFIKGRSGNPRGRPHKGDSLAEAVRARFDRPKRNQALDKIIALTTGPHKNPTARIRAFEVLAHTGWPHEQKGDVSIVTPEAKSVIVNHHYDLDTSS